MTVLMHRHLASLLVYFAPITRFRIKTASGVGAIGDGDADALLALYDSSAHARTRSLGNFPIPKVVVVPRPSVWEEAGHVGKFTFF